MSLGDDHSEELSDRSRAVAARDRFLSMVSHELKTPLSTLSLHLQVLTKKLDQAGPAGVPPAALEDRIDLMSRQVGHLDSLINRLLDVGRIAEGRLDLRPSRVDLASIVDDVTKRFGDELERAECELELDAPGPHVGEWDRNRIDQILTNLLSNAVRYAPGSRIRIALRGDESTATIIIEDDGPGLEERERERMFERFESVVLDHTDGLRLGLWIVRQIVEAMDGEIAVESSPADGTRFAIELPRTTK